MAKELERVGIPAALITALPSLVQTVGAARVVPGVSVIHPTGNPALTKALEYELRKSLVRKALSALRADLSSPAIFA